MTRHRRAALLGVMVLIGTALAVLAFLPLSIRRSPTTRRASTGLP